MNRRSGFAYLADGEVLMADGVTATIKTVVKHDAQGPIVCKALTLNEFGAVPFLEATGRNRRERLANARRLARVLSVGKSA